MEEFKVSDTIMSTPSPGGSSANINTAESGDKINVSVESFSSPQGDLGSDEGADSFGSLPALVDISVEEPPPPEVLLGACGGGAKEEEDAKISHVAPPLHPQRQHSISIIDDLAKIPFDAPLDLTMIEKPEKPPRKISAEKFPPMYKALVMVSTDRPDVTMDIPSNPPPPPPPSIQGGGSSGSSSTIKEVCGAAGPSHRKSPGFAYGLGSPLGKPAYGVKGHGGGDEEVESDDRHHDPMASPSKMGRPSIADISLAAQNFRGRQWICLIVFGLADLFSAMVISLQAPFYPPEAERKGATASEYGLVFGVYELVVFLTSPIFGKYMNKIGPRAMFNTGIMTTALSCIAFGFLDEIDDHVWFISLSFVFRVTEALGASAFVTSSFSIIACEFPESVATTFASLETFFGLGLIIGPSVGGALYEVGGYTLPFLVTGVGLLAISMAAAIIMPTIETISDDDGDSSSGYGIFSILRIPGVAIAAVALVITSNSVGFLSATLEPHLRPFGLSPTKMGLMFIIYGGVYAITAPVFGRICDRISKPIYLILMGAVLIFVAFLLIGPAPFILMETELWMTGVGLVVLGFGLSATLVAGFISCLREAMAYGFPDNLFTYAVVSGLWTSSVSLGAFMGPSVGGILYETFTFRPGTFYIMGSEAFLVVVICVYILVEGKSVPIETAECDPLLRPGSPIIRGRRGVKDVEAGKVEGSSATSSTITPIIASGGSGGTTATPAIGSGSGGTTATPAIASGSGGTTATPAIASGSGGTTATPAIASGSSGGGDGAIAKLDSSEAFVAHHM